MRPAALAGASADVLTLVDGLQPYLGGNDNLWRLHRLDIFDKHQVLVPVGAAYNELIFNLKMPGSQGLNLPLALKPTDRMFPLQDGMDVYRVCAAARGASDGWESPQFHFLIAFGDGQVVDGEPVYSSLDGVVKEVERVTELFPEYT